MISVERAALETAIVAGATRYTRWMICRIDGAVYRQSLYATEHQHRNQDVIIPSLYPDGSGTRFALFCGWARKHEDKKRGEELIALAYGKRNDRVNPEGHPYAVLCIINQFLTESEKAAWEFSQAARVRYFCDICLQQLNSLGGRAKYRWKYPDQYSHLHVIPGPSWASMPHAPLPPQLRAQGQSHAAHPRG